MTKPAHWPLLTLAGITCAVLIGIAHSAALTIRSYLACEDDLAPRFMDGDGHDDS